MKSYWMNNCEEQQYQNLENNQEADVCIIGGGLTGITTAYYLSKTNLKVVLLEKSTIGKHTSRKFNW